MEGILGPPQGGHIARRTLEKLMQAEGDEKEAIEKQASLERERRRAAREARIVPETNEGLVEFFMQTEAQDFDFEIARCRLRLNGEFFSYLQQEVSSLRFSLDRTKDVEDRLVELEALQQVLIEGTEAYDKLSLDLVRAKAQLARILASKDKRATLLEMVAKNELDRSLLALLDQNIATANAAGQEQVSKFMEKIRGAVLKYISL
ncbi:hypothetical protein O6H91_20G023700 [Diphasiastrum complanatum]|uniref:Uncharacterized protein n=1 Tax=Diphasiastrum complanatum TaxID=34168 RepID=A0ACC2ANY1_DIPCM|nr:hypothetical protein O6H91_20G023700 [Diphasiastrum complanatum]